jgi:flavin reductase (DIM6/NTAB) family NADH-FMN oxidoreductase RutF
MASAVPAKSPPAEGPDPRSFRDALGRFATAGADRFAGLKWEPGASGVPVVRDALATLECEIVAEHAAGDHWIVVGRVDHLRTSPGKAPLLFFAGELGALHQPS